MPKSHPRAAAARSPLDHDPARLRRRRIEIGKSQQEIARLAGLSSGHLSELERGTRNPSPGALLRIAGALGCETRDLMPTHERAVA